MKYLHLHNRLATGALALAMLSGLPSCIKNQDTPLAVSLPSNAAPFGTLDEALSSGGSSLFRQAVKRSGLDSVLRSAAASFTVLAPTDSAMQVAGLTAQNIQSLSPDSLKKLVSYHIIQGGLSTTELRDAAFTIKAPTLVIVPPFPNQYTDNDNLLSHPLPVFIKYYENNGLYINDQKVANAEAPIPAANGYVYFTRKVIMPPFERTVWDFIKSQPDLSLYYEALKIVDSINVRMNNINGYNEFPDTVIFQRLGVYVRNYIRAWGTRPNCLTVFAPTNAAFAAAGFNTPEDIRAFAAIDFNTSPTYQSPMDSMLRRHVVFNYNNANPGKTILLYGDLANRPGYVNGAGMNVYIKSLYAGWDGGNYMKLAPLVFSASGGIPYIKWSSDPLKPLVPIPAENHFMGSNGAVYKVNTFFFRN
ncbi:fasciclin domain-containing protein [Chitinophaga sp. 22620]|uniref:fasciclin domain-containing protein n=1 Tax=Chitinophaga sp. 22620 TaxID=3453952 RepID=UPI003F86667B